MPFTQKLEANEIPVKAYRADTGEFVGQFKSCAEAGKRLYIRKHSNVSDFVRRNQKRTSGVLSYKTGIRYKFEKVEKA